MNTHQGKHALCRYFPENRSLIYVCVCVCMCERERGGGILYSCKFLDFNLKAIMKRRIPLLSNTCAVTYLYNSFFLWSNWFFNIFFQSPQHHRFQNELKLLHFCFSLQSSKFLEEGLTAWELCWLQEVEQREQFIYIVLERRSRQQDSVFL